VGGHGPFRGLDAPLARVHHATGGSGIQDDLVNLFVESEKQAAA
jgi:hypothetical protein